MHTFALFIHTTFLHCEYKTRERTKHSATKIDNNSLEWCTRCGSSAHLNKRIQRDQARQKKKQIKVGRVRDQNGYCARRPMVVIKLEYVIRKILFRSRKLPAATGTRFPRIDIQDARKWNNHDSARETHYEVPGKF